MQNLIAIIYVLTMVAGSNNSTYQHTDLLPETVIIASRDQNTNIGHEYVLPEVLVVADRYAPVKSAKPTQVEPIAIAEKTKKTLNLTLDLRPNFAYAKPVYDVEVVPCSKTRSGNCNIAAGDTIKEDMTVTGGNAQIDGVLDGDLAADHRAGLDEGGVADVAAATHDIEEAARSAGLSGISACRPRFCRPGTP